MVNMEEGNTSLFLNKSTLKCRLSHIHFVLQALNFHLERCLASPSLKYTKSSVLERSSLSRATAARAKSEKSSRFYVTELTLYDLRYIFIFFPGKNLFRVIISKNYKKSINRNEDGWLCTIINDQWKSVFTAGTNSVYVRKITFLDI